MGYVKYCVRFGVSKLILYGFSTDSLWICGRFALDMSLSNKLDLWNMRNATRRPDAYFCQIALRILYGFSTDSLRIRWVVFSGGAGGDRNTALFDPTQSLRILYGFSTDLRPN